MTCVCGTVFVSEGGTLVSVCALHWPDPSEASARCGVLAECSEKAGCDHAPGGDDVRQSAM